MTKILIVDDEPEILDLLRTTLGKEGYNIHLGVNGQQAVSLAAKLKPDLIIMDVMMPIMDGMEATRQIRQNPETEFIPIVLLTALTEEFAELAGFSAGADDYIAKPVRPRVLVSRIKAILRKNAPKNAEEENTVLQFKDLTINKEKVSVDYNGKSLQFPKKEFSLLFLLASKPGKVFSRDEILEKVWGNDVFVIDRTIDVHIRKIREKLENKYIQTLKGIGYKFEEESHR